MSLSRRFPHSISSAGGSFAPPDDIVFDEVDEDEDGDELAEKSCHHGWPMNWKCPDCHEEYIDSHDCDFPEEAA
jgi:hypothetical protein